MGTGSSSLNKAEMKLSTFSLFSLSALAEQATNSAAIDAKMAELSPIGIAGEWQCEKSRKRKKECWPNVLLFVLILMELLITFQCSNGPRRKLSLDMELLRSSPSRLRAPSAAGMKSRPS